MIKGQEFWELRHVTDERLHESIRGLVHADRHVSARLLAHLAEVEERRLHLKQANSSMFEYCLQLGMSEDEAGRRLCAARVAKAFPKVYALLDEGKLSLSVICLLKPHLTDSNHLELLEGVSGMSYRRAEVWLAERFPKPDAAPRIRKLPERGPSIEQKPSADPTPMATEIASSLPVRESPLAPALTLSPEAYPPARNEPAPKARSDRRCVPLATDRYRVQFTADSKLKQKLELAADLMAHRNPSRDFAPIVESALDLLIAQLEKQRFGKTSRSRRARPAKRDRVTNSTRRAVLERDGLQCSYVDENGRRCTARAFLEHDHRLPRGKGGGSGPDNVRHLCRAHNGWLAELEYGRDHIERAKRAAGARRKPDAVATSRPEPANSTRRVRDTT